MREPRVVMPESRTVPSHFGVRAWLPAHRSKSPGYGAATVRLGTGVPTQAGKPGGPPAVRGNWREAGAGLLRLRVIRTQRGLWWPGHRA